MNKHVLARLRARWNQVFGAGLWLLLAFPASNNYKLDGFSYSGGVLGEGTSGSYKMNATLGEVSSSSLTGLNYLGLPGMEFVISAQVPPAPTLTNGANYYNKLSLVLSTGNNASDTLYAVAVSPDDFVTTYYLQNDNRLGTTLGIEDYQTYANWGGGSGEFMIGLSPSTTYKVKVKAMQGDFTETDWGPTASTATVGSSLSFDIDVSSSNEETAPPYVVAMSDLTPGSVTTATEKIWIDLDTNGEGGGFVYVYGSNGGLYSTTTTYTISSATADLTGVNEGFGIRSNSVTQTSGGPVAALSPYNLSADNVGQVSATTQTVFNSSSEPVVAGRGSLLVKAKISAQTPAASDYAETLTMVASATF